MLLIIGCAPASTNITGAMTIQPQSSKQTEPAKQNTPIPSDAPKAVSGNQQAVSWSIEYAVSGGIAGIRRQMEFSSDGKLIATDFKRKKRIEQQAAPEQLSNISNILSKMDFSRAQKTSSELSDRCRDCFEYTVTVFINGTKYELHADDVSLKGLECTNLVGLLSVMLNQSLAEQRP